MGDKAASMPTEVLETMKIPGKENELGTCNCRPEVDANARLRRIMITLFLLCAMQTFTYF